MVSFPAGSISARRASAAGQWAGEPDSVRRPAYAKELAELRGRGLRPLFPVYVTDSWDVARFLREWSGNDYVALVVAPIDTPVDYGACRGLDVVVVHAHPDSAASVAVGRLQAAGASRITVWTRPAWLAMTEQFLLRGRRA